MTASAGPMVCGRCRLRLNTFTDIVTGDIEYAHGRPEADLDHTPEPVPATGKEQDDCDFCGTANSRYVYEGEEVQVALVDDEDNPRAVHAYDRFWAACMSCRKLIDARDLIGLVDRNQYVNHGVGRKPPSPESLFQIYRAVVPTFGPPTFVPPPPPDMTDIPPTRMPKVRDRLAQYWAENMCRNITRMLDVQPFVFPAEDIGEEAARYDKPFLLCESLPKDAIARFCRRVETGLLVADLFWVSAEFTRLATAIAAKLKDFSFSREQMPADHGFIVWQQPIAKLGKEGMDMVAASWTLVPTGIWVTTYMRAEQYIAYDDKQILREKVGWFIAGNPGGGITFNTKEQLGGDEASRFLAALLATWILMKSPGVAQTTDGPTDKATRRSYAYRKRELPRVRVVDLRPGPKKERRESDGSSQPRAGWSYRVLMGAETGGFERTYWTGPGRTVPIRRWLLPYLTGTDDMPLKEDLDIQTVKVLK